MSRLPLTGAVQRDARAIDHPLRIASTSIIGWRATDGVLVPLQSGIATTVRQRTSSANVHASDGTTITLAAAAPAFTSVDWDGDGVRETEALLQSAEEAVRWHAPSGAGLHLPVGSLTLRHDWIEAGAIDDELPLWSLTDDAAAGGLLVLAGDGAGGVNFSVDNGTTSVIATCALAAPIAIGDRVSARATLVRDGDDVRVQLALVHVPDGELAPVALGDLAWRTAPEVLGALSSAITAPSSWGDGGGVRVRLNEFGDALRGVQRVHASFLYPGVCARADFAL